MIGDILQTTTLRSGCATHHFYIVGKVIDAVVGRNTLCGESQPHARLTYARKTCRLAERQALAPVQQCRDFKLEFRLGY